MTSPPSLPPTMCVEQNGLVLCVNKNDLWENVIFKMIQKVEDDIRKLKTPCSSYLQ